MPNCTMKPVIDAEEPRIVVKAVLDQIVEPVGADRRPIAMNLDDERPLAGVES